MVFYRFAFQRQRTSSSLGFFRDGCGSGGLNPARESAGKPLDTLFSVNFPDIKTALNKAMKPILHPVLRAPRVLKQARERIHYSSHGEQPQTRGRVNRGQRIGVRAQIRRTSGSPCGFDASRRSEIGIWPRFAPCACLGRCDALASKAQPPYRNTALPRAASINPAASPGSKNPSPIARAAAWVTAVT